MYRITKIHLHGHSCGVQTANPVQLGERVSLTLSPMFKPEQSSTLPVICVAYRLLPTADHDGATAEVWFEVENQMTEAF